MAWRKASVLVSAVWGELLSRIEVPLLVSQPVRYPSISLNILTFRRPVSIADGAPRRSHTSTARKIGTIDLPRRGGNLNLSVPCQAPGRRPLPSPEEIRAVVLQAGGQPVPGHRLIRPLGAGAFGEVWEA